MGGNVFNNTRRYSASEYHALVPEVLGKLRLCSLICDADVIEAYRTKESFGDMDLIYSTHLDSPVTADVVKHMFNIDDISVNGEVISIAYKELQIDLIHSKRESFQYASRYFRFNDLGNLIGKLTKRFNLKHGHRGLTLPLRVGTNMFAEVEISQNHAKTLNFVGLDAAKFEAGFETLEEIFEYVSSSPYYNPEFYKLENLNTIAKVRDRKRNTYRKFLEFGESWTGPAWTEYAVDRDDYLERIFEFFPEAKPKFDHALEKLAIQQYVSSKFNGMIVQELTNLEGKQLGEFMKFLRKQFEFQQSMVIHSSSEKIASNVMKLYNKFVSENL